MCFITVKRRVIHLTIRNPVCFPKNGECILEKQLKRIFGVMVKYLSSYAVCCGSKSKFKSFGCKKSIKTVDKNLFWSKASRNIFDI